MHEEQDALITLFRQLSEEADDVFWVSDPETGRVLFLSESYEKLWGVPRQSVYERPKSFLDGIHPDDREQVAAAHKLQALGMYDESYRLVRPDGTTHWVHAKAYPIRNARGEVTAICGIAEDITATKLAEAQAESNRQQLEASVAERSEQLRRQFEALHAAEQNRSESEARLKRMVESAHDAVIAIDADGLVTDWNNRASIMFGWPREAAIGRSLSTLIIPEDYRARHEAGLSRVAASDSSVLDRVVEVPAMRRDGSQFPVELSISSFHAGGRIAFAAFVRDISARRAAEQALQQSEERYRRVVENVGQGMVVVQDRRFVFLNPRAEEITGYTLADVGALEFDSIIHPDDRDAVRDRHLKRLRGEPVEHTYEFRIIDKSGKVRWLEIGGALITWDGAPATLTFFSDISRRKALEEELKRTLAERETILQHSIVGIAFLAPTGRLRWGNDGLSRIFRAELEPAIGASLEAFYPSREEYLRIGGEVSKAVLKGQMFETELCMQRSTGEPFWAYLSGKAVNPQDLSQGTVWIVMDISRRRELEDQLKSKTAEQEVILQTSQIGIAHTVNRVHRWVNRSFCEMVGFRPDELIGASSRIHFPDDATFEQLGAEAYPEMALGHAYTCETRMMRKNGDVFWVQMRGKNIDPEDPAHGAIWTVLDITERRRLEETLQRQSAEQEVILQTCQIGLSFTRQRIIQWINRSFVDMLGFSAEELIGQVSRIHFPNDESFEQFGALAYPVLAQDGVVTCEWPMVRKDGEPIWLDMRGKNIDPDDPAKGTIWSVMDITPRKRMEEALRATSSEREAILQSALVGITFSVNRVHQWVNRTFADMMGYEPDSLIGQSSRLHYPSEDSWRQLGEQAYPQLVAGGTFESEWQMQRRDGTVFWVQIYGCSVERGHPEKGTIWTFLDITRRKQAEEATLRALEKQKELNDLKSRFVSMTSHEFRTPLATILSSAELLKHYSDRLPAEEKVEILSSIETSVKRMTQMLDNVLLIGKAEAQMLSFKPESIDLRALCADCIEEARTAVRSENPPEIRAEIGPEIATGVFDEKLLRHVLGNLLSNAIKYSPHGGIVTFSVSHRAGATEFSVTDQGIGIPKKDLPRLFETFHRAENVGNIQGTGLGLAIVGKSVELHGGTISVDSEEGRGTSFRVVIPDAGGKHA
jgi:PAS domain S-box-containing protein